MKKVLLITSGQPALNPRLVKEADCLTNFGYNVTVLYQYWNEWGTKLDKDLLKTKKWKALRVGGSPTEEILVFYFTKAIHKICKILFFYGGVKSAAIGAIARSSFLLIRKAKKIKADLYIGHNLGALSATFIAAKYHKAKCGFDAEDFHRHDMYDDPFHKDVLLKKYIEEKFIPQLNFLTGASPLISKQYKGLFKTFEVTTIYNVFPKACGLPTANFSNDNLVKLFWFSQTIGNNRGIENVFKALAMLQHIPLELHLLGYSTLMSKEKIVKLQSNTGLSSLKIFFHPPMPPHQIIPFAAQFDIGLATETGIPLNRDICLTNKIFTYIQAGLAIVASDTQAQAELLQQYKGIGLLYKKGNQASLAEALKFYFERNDELIKAKQASFYLGQTKLNWETEQVFFLEKIKEVLN